MAVMKIDRNKLDQYIQACIDQGVTYGLGDKDPILGAFPPDYESIDCSGFMRALIHYSTDGEVTMPDGSWNQLDWLIAQGFPQVNFDTCVENDDSIRICVYEQPGHTGHVWLVMNGITYESHGHAGPSHRDWNNQVLAGISKMTKVFLVA